MTPHVAPAIHFIGVGGERCGSTWYSRMLGVHPDLFVPRVKEVDYFSDRYERGWEWYDRHFDGVDQAMRLGEVSPSYLYDEDAASRIVSAYPDIRIICLVRDPFERAISHLLLIAQTEFGRMSSLGLEPLRQLAASDPKFVERSLYTPGLKRFYDALPPEQIFVAGFKRVADDPKGLMRELYAHLGVDEGFEPPGLGERVNDAKDYRWHGAFKTLRAFSRTGKSSPATRWAIEALQRWGIRRALMELFEVRRGRPDVPFEEVFSDGDQARLEAEVAEVGALLGDDIWEMW